MFEIDRNIDTPSAFVHQLVTNRTYLSDWIFRHVGKKEWIKAKIPRCNFTDLIENKLIDYPFYRDNEDKFQWIEKEDWECSITFSLTEKDLNFDIIELVFEGLDTAIKLVKNLYVSLEAMFHMQKSLITLTKTCIRTETNLQSPYSNKRIERLKQHEH